MELGPLVDVFWKFCIIFVRLVKCIWEIELKGRMVPKGKGLKSQAREFEFN